MPTLSGEYQRDNIKQFETFIDKQIKVNWLIKLFLLNIFYWYNYFDWKSTFKTFHTDVYNLILTHIIVAKENLKCIERQ